MHRGLLTPLILLGLLNFCTCSNGQYGDKNPVPPPVNGEGTQESATQSSANDPDANPKSTPQTTTASPAGINNIAKDPQANTGQPVANQQVTESSGQFLNLLQQQLQTQQQQHQQLLHQQQQFFQQLQQQQQQWLQQQQNQDLQLRLRKQQLELQQLQLQSQLQNQTYPENNWTATNRPHMTFSLHSADDTFRCPLKLLHIPYGVWIEIEDSWYQHKCLDNTKDVCVSFDLPPGGFQPSIMIRTASSPSEIRQSETSMSERILLVPGRMVECDYARTFGDRTRKQLSKSEQRLVNMSPAGLETWASGRMASATVSFAQSPQPDQLSSIQAEQIAASIDLTANGNVWSASPTTGPLFLLRATPRLLSSLAPNIRLKADVTTSYNKSANETVTGNFKMVQIEGELGKGKVLSADKAQYDCVFDFNRLFNNDSEFAKYIGSARNNAIVNCEFSNVKLEFYNNRFEKTVISSTEGIPLHEFKLKLSLKFPGQ